MLFALIACITAAESAAGQAVLNTIDEKGIRGKLVSMDANGSISFETESKEVKRTQAADVVSIVFSDLAAKQEKTDIELTLHNGDVFLGAVEPQDAPAQGFAFRDRSAGLISLPDLGMVQWIRFPSSKGKKLVVEGEAARDFVFLGNGDRISGTVDSISSKGVAVDRSGDVKTFPLDELLAVYIAPLVPVKPLEGVFGVFILRNGGMTHGKVKKFENGIFSLSLAIAKDQEIAVEEVLNVSFRNGNFTYLSDVVPAGIVEIRALFEEPLTCKPPFGKGSTHHFHPDRSYDGNRISIGGKRFYKGIGSYSWTEIRYRLDGAYRRFETLAGIDDEVMSRLDKGSVVFRVLVDGKEAARSPVMKGGMAPVKLAADLAGAATLSLIVDYAGDPLELEDDDTSDNADWAEAILVKK